MYQTKTSRNKALLMRRLVNLKLQRETTVVEHTSEFQNVVNQLTSVNLQFDDEMQSLIASKFLARELGDISGFSQQFSTEWEVDYEKTGKEVEVKEEVITKILKKGRWRSQTRGRTVRCFYYNQEGHIKRDCPKYKAQDQSSNTIATAVMADDDEIDVLLAASDDGKLDWVLDSGSAYHLCRDRMCSLHTQHARDVYGWRTTQLAELLAEDQSGSAWQTGDSKGCSFDTSGGTLRVFKGNKEILWGKKTGGLYRLEGSVQTREATVQHGSSGISKKSGQEKQPLHRDTGTRGQEDALRYVRKSGQTRVMQPVQDVQREAQRKEIKSILRSCTAKGAMTPKRVSFALDLISSGDLSSCAHKRREMEP
ncbi:hypothetical protein Acr_00g0050380 [Actinidia rufa]|uniref:Uncharacterized protein n=1 Tax=Actinidia rufa TaxID=165716 RepID=A0A7J0DL62_9ERIC|nr:hypothetical protein Acr_00g0050380 [Actinidia rufa]